MNSFARAQRAYENESEDVSDAERAYADLRSDLHLSREFEAEALANWLGGTGECRALISAARAGSLEKMLEVVREWYADDRLRVMHERSRINNQPFDLGDFAASEREAWLAPKPISQRNEE